MGKSSPLLGGQTGILRLGRMGLAVAFLVVVAGVWALYMGPFVTHLELWSDGERDLFQAWAAAHTSWEPSEGPMIAGIQSANLGTGWIQLMKVVMAWAPTPLGVYRVHVGFTALGVGLLFLVLWTRINPWTAVLTCLLMVLSAYLARTLRILWHPALAPAFACFWFSSLLMALTSSGDRTRAWWLVVAWAMAFVLLQLHLIALVYLAVLGAIQLWFWWRGGWRSAPVAALMSLGLIVASALVAVPILWSLVTAPRTHQLDLGHTIAEKATFLVAMFGSALIDDYSNDYAWSGLGVLVWVMGTVGFVRAWRPGASITERWVAIFVIVGGALTALSLRAGLGPRYVTAFAPGLFLLAGLSLSRIRVPRLSSKVPVGLLIVALLLVLDPVRGQALRTEFVRGSTYLNIVEVERSLEEIHRRKNLNWKGVRMRVHGLVLTAPTFRYVSLSQGLVTAPEPTDDTHHWTLVTPGQPPPAYGTQAWNFDGGAGRILGFVEHLPRFDYDEVRFSIADDPCKGLLPFHSASQPTFDVLEAVGMVDINARVSTKDDTGSCGLRMFNGMDKKLFLMLPPIVGAAPLTLLVNPSVTIDRIEAVSTSGKTLTVTEHDTNPLLTGPLRKYPDFLVYQVAVVQGEGLKISWLGSSGLSFDIY